MNLRDQAASSIRRHFGGKNGFFVCFRWLAVLALFYSGVFGLSIRGSVIVIASSFVLFAAALAILVIKEGAFQKELQRRRGLPSSAIRGASN